MNEILIGLGALMTVEEGGDLADSSCVIRLGLLEERINAAEEFGVWGTVSRSPRNFEDLAGSFYRTDPSGEQQPIANEIVRPVVERLRDDGLIVGFDPDSAQLARLADRVRAVLLHRAFTAVPIESQGVPIGTASSVECVLTHRQATLWAGLADSDSVALAAIGIALSDGIDPRDADLAGSFEDCLELVRLGAAYFDAVAPSPSRS